LKQRDEIQSQQKLYFSVLLLTSVSVLRWQKDSFLLLPNQSFRHSMSVHVQQVSKIYGEQKALDSLSLTIHPGEIVGLLGPNGAGKSTLMKILSCYIPPTSGTASIMGFDVRLQPVEVRRLVGYLPENNPLYLDMYIKEYLLFVAGVFGLGKQSAARVNQMIELTGLGDELHKKIGMLSKGYRQRVGLAQALMHDPQVLILDEPTSGLDPNQLVDIRRLIKETGANKTVILSTHIMQEVEALCSRVAILNKGILVAYDEIGAIRSDEKKETVSVEFAEEVSIGQLKGIEGVVSVVREGSQWVLISAAGTDIRQALNSWAAANSFTILSLARKTHRMEESFQKLTGKQIE